MSNHGQERNISELEWCWNSINPKEIESGSILIFKFVDLDKRREESFKFCQHLIKFLPEDVTIHIIDAEEDAFIIPPQSIQPFIDKMKDENK